MPELPDVEEFRRVLASCATGRRIERVEVADAGVLRGVTARRLRQRLTGRTFAAPRRHGKWLLAPTEGPTVLFHFGMTGNLRCDPADASAAPHDRVTLTLDDGRRLRYRDQRKLRGIWFAATAADVDRMLADQGPDALALAPGELAELLAAQRRRVKAALLDQSTVAGLGNLLADEILWHARVHPARRAVDLTDDERRRVDSAARHVLRGAVPAGHVPAKPSWLTARRDAPAPHCPRCDTPLRHSRVAGRTTLWCPACQPE
ncbi:Fpg/Nei family DNA glycosylase [Streptomyces sp. 8K308]|uniref:Fpg/Nei family DNA glycosylase n=1 Tax=Streptomyces sp. 8K308 TaxID=2530388 RepID=UPI001051E306|nr:DNA-formamidopyrimidine glycosylase family protein [Streptomyces sp. 8K308]TDC26416.1 Fpg/Nei family DNA glycosylase [Streptomyces sp. 8K308]